MMFALWFSPNRIPIKSRGFEGHFTYKTESLWPIHFKHSHWWEKRRLSKFDSHYDWGTNKVCECKMDVKSTWYQQDHVSWSLGLFQKPPLGGRPNTKLGDHGTLNPHNHCVRATSDTRLRAHDHYTSRTLIGGNGGAGSSSLHTMLEEPTEYVNARWMQSLHGFLNGIKGTVFYGPLDYFQKPHLGGRPNTKLGDHGTPNAHNCWFILFYHVWGPSWIEIPWNSIWLSARSHITSHYTWGSMTTQHDFGGVLGRPLDNFFWALSISWSRLLARVWSGPCSILSCVRILMNRNSLKQHLAKVPVTLHTTLEDPWRHYIILEVCWDGLSTLSFELSQFHCNGSWLIYD